MSFAAESWLNVSLNPNGPSRPLLTCFPVTFHDWFVSAPESECHYVDRRFKIANDLILLQDISYYRAWMQITSTPEDRLPSILRLDAGTCQKLLNNPSSKLKKFSVPAMSVLRFCKEVGVHPAYLQPQLTSIDYSLVTAVVELVREKTKKEVKDLFKISSIPEKDRLVANLLCKREFSNYLGCFERNKKSKFYLDRGLGMMRAYNRVKIDNNGLASGFNYLMGYHQSDVQDALKLFEESLIKEVAKHNSSLRDMNFKAAHIAISLEEYSQVIFGDKNATYCLDIVVKKIEEILLNRDLPENIWAYLRDEILTGATCLDDILEGRGEFAFPSIHPDFEILADRYHLDHEECKDDFLDLLEKYINVRNVHSNESQKLHIAKACLNVLYDWLKDPQTENHINIFKNGISVMPYGILPTASKSLIASKTITAASHVFDLENPYRR